MPISMTTEELIALLADERHAGEDDARRSFAQQRADSPNKKEQRPTPTVREFYATLLDACEDETVANYGTYWRKLVEALGDKQLADVTKTDVMGFAKLCRKSALVRRNSREGLGARRNAVAAARCFFANAKDAHHIKTNPAKKVRHKPYDPALRRALVEHELDELYDLEAKTVDPELYTLLLRFHHETGARRGGGLTLRLMDLDYRRGMIELHEKGLTVREVPATEELLRSLIRHCLSRTSPDAPGEQRIFRSKTGNPISRGTYGRVHDRWYQSESLRNLGVTVHWLRHTAIAEYREIGGLSVSTAFAGHSLRNRTTNENYGGAQPADVIDAFERRSGEAHPLGSGTIRPPLTL